MGENEFIIRCMRCGQKNRIKRQRLNDRPRCGRCGAVLDELIIRCMECGTRNFIPEDRVSDRPVCGKCHTPLYQGTLVEITDDSFDREVAGFPGPVVVCIWTPSCELCCQSLPIIEQIAHRYAGGIKIARLNIDQNPRIAAEYEASETPSYLIFKDGIFQMKLSGALTRLEIEQHLKSILKKKQT